MKIIKRILCMIAIAILVVAISVAGITIVKRVRNKIKEKIEDVVEETQIQIELPEIPQNEDMEDKFCRILESEHPEEMIDDLEEISQYEYADAQFILGELYFQGLGVEKDTVKAADYLSQAMKNGHADAALLYAKMSFLGDGTLQDYEESLKIFKSMARSDKYASLMTGIMYIYGMGDYVDYTTSSSYLNYASDLDTAQYFINILKNIGAYNDTGTDISDEEIYYTYREYSGNDKLETLLKDYEAKLLSTEQYDEFDEEIEAVKNTDVDTAKKTTVFGKDDWLYFMSKTDGDAYHDYVGDNAFTESELKQIANSLNERKKKINASGSEFVLLILPNKEEIYTEYMPSFIVRESEVTRTDKLVEYLEANTDINIIYMKDTYLSQKENYQLYYKTDTHYNMIGSFLALTSVIEGVYGKNISMDMDKFVTHMEDYCGDLGVMLEREDRYSIDTVYFLPESSAKITDYLDKSVTIIGDSFSEFLNIEAQYYFRNGVNHVMIKDHGFDYDTALDYGLNSNKTDLVIFEIAERYADRLK